jgi:hypothetical protein
LKTVTASPFGSVLSVAALPLYVPVLLLPLRSGSVPEALLTAQ